MRQYTNIMLNCLFCRKSAGLQYCNLRKNEESRPNERLPFVTMVILSFLDDKLDGCEVLTVAHDRAEVNAVIEFGH